MLLGVFVTTLTAAIRIFRAEKLMRRHAMSIVLPVADRLLHFREITAIIISFAYSVIFLAAFSINATLICALRSISIEAEASAVMAAISSKRDVLQTWLFQWPAAKKHSSAWPYRMSPHHRRQKDVLIMPLLASLVYYISASSDRRRISILLGHELA